MRVLNLRRPVTDLPHRVVSDLPYRPVADLPYRVVSVAEPVGAVVTDTGLTFAIAPLRPYARPVRLTCTQCSWQVVVVGLPAIGERARGHASMHDPVRTAVPPSGWWPGLVGNTDFGRLGRARRRLRNLGRRFRNPGRVSSG